MTRGDDALRSDLDLLWVRDRRGRLVRARTPEHRTAPLLVVGTTATGTAPVWAASTVVPDEVVARVAATLAGAATGAPPGDDGWVPSSADLLLDLLGPHGPVELGVAHVLGGRPRAQPLTAGAALRTSADADAEEVRALVPARDRLLTAPWAAALVDGEVAAVCESARLLPWAAAAGVWTYPPHRRQGLASAVTAAWAGLVEGTPHYGHDALNGASAGVAQRVGFRPIGWWWWVRPSAP